MAAIHLDVPVPAWNDHIANCFNYYIYGAFFSPFRCDPIKQLADYGRTTTTTIYTTLALSLWPRYVQKADEKWTMLNLNNKRVTVERISTEITFTI